MAGDRSYLQWIHNLPLTQENKKQEMTIIKQMTNIKRFPNNVIENLNHKTPTLQITQNNLNKRWDKFTYYNPIITRITNLFKKTNIGISFKISNNISSFNRNTKPTNNSLENSGVCEMKCHSCNLSYIGQTGQI